MNNVTQEELKQAEQLSLVTIQAEQNKLNRIRKQLKELEAEIDYESYVGKCYYRKDNDGCQFYKILKTTKEGINSTVFISLILDFPGTWNDPGVITKIEFDFIALYLVNILEEIDLADFKEKYSPVEHLLSEIIYNNSTKTPYD
jgi:hypothetical protein